MEYKNFAELIEKVQNMDHMKRVAVVAAQDEHTLQAVFLARRNNIAEPILIGNRAEILEVLKALGEKMDESMIIEAEDDAASARKAVELIHEGKADFIMKGRIQTADLLRAVVDKEKGLRTGSVMSHLVLHELPGYHKLLAVTDGGMMMYPDLEQKKGILMNAVDAYHAMGVEEPKVAVLAAVEVVNPKMPESVDAGKLKEMNLSGEIDGCIVEGPISFDLCMSRESAKIKGYHSPVVGDADIMIVPDIAAGNILGKALVYAAGARMAGFIVGAKVPIVMTSRGSTADEKYLSLVLSAAAAKTDTTTMEVEI